MKPNFWTFLILINMAFSISCSQKGSNSSEGSLSQNSTMVSNGQINNSGGGVGTGESNIKLESFALPMVVASQFSSVEEISSVEKSDWSKYIMIRNIALANLYKKSCSENLLAYLRWWIQKVKLQLESLRPEDSSTALYENQLFFMLRLLSVKLENCAPELSLQDSIELHEITLKHVISKLSAVERELEKKSLSDQERSQLSKIQVFLKELKDWIESFLGGLQN